jgi:predicted acetyltransferase
MELRPIRSDELAAFAEASEAAFHEAATPEYVERTARTLELPRTLAIFDDGRPVATTAIYSRELTIPGATVPAACVSQVGVLASHRRRGLLTQLMRRQLDDVRAGGREALAILWASEPVIYGRFGYGIASRSAEIALRTPGTRVQRGVAAHAGRFVLLDPEDALERIAPFYDRARRTRTGHLDRDGAWWSKRIHDPESERRGAGPLRAVVHEAADGAVDGYALYAVRTAYEVHGPDGEVVVRELMADGPGATVAMWSFLLGLDLTRRVTWEIGAADEPLAWILEGPYRPRFRLFDNLWVRLVDVGSALALRRYSGALDIVFEVEDAFCTWNIGRWRLRAGADGVAACERTDDAPDLRLPAGALAAAYLGGPSLRAIAAAGQVVELRAGALDAASAAFRAPREPWCPEIF